jgi:hypothetical protein
MESAQRLVDVRGNADESNNDGTIVVWMAGLNGGWLYSAILWKGVEWHMQTRQG